MKAFFKSYDNSHISYVDAEGEIGVKKKQYTFHKRKRKALDFDVSMLRMDKLLFEESICNVGTIVCYSLNYCQYLPHEKTTLNVRKEFWKMFYENQKVYGLDIPQQLHLKANVRKWKHHYSWCQGLWESLL